MMFDEVPPPRPEAEEIAENPPLAELRDRLHGREPVTGDIDSARLVHEERESR